MRMAGLTSTGEARIVDDAGRLVAYAELRLEDAHIVGVDSGDRFPLEVVITWTKAEQDAINAELDDADPRLCEPPKR
jgi:hypothetical protein